MTTFNYFKYRSWGTKMLREAADFYRGVLTLKLLGLWRLKM